MFTYRGIDIDTNQFVYGDLLNINKKNKFIIKPVNGQDIKSYFNGKEYPDIKYFKVYKKSIGISFENYDDDRNKIYGNILLDEKETYGGDIITSNSYPFVDGEKTKLYWNSEVGCL